VADKKQADSNPFTKMAREGRRQFLATNAPTGKRVLDVNNWIKNLGITKTKQKKIDTLINELTNYYKLLPKLEQSTIGIDKLAVEWGLPVRTAAGLTNEQLIKVISTASMLLD